MARTTTLNPHGEAAKRALDLLKPAVGAREAKRIGKTAQEQNAAAIAAGEHTPFRKLVSVEEILAAAGVAPERIPVLAARLRTGTKAQVDFVKELGLEKPKRSRANATA